LARSKGARFFTALAPCVVGSPANPSASLLVQYAARAEDWWFASAFERLDGRTAVWVAKRFAAAIIEAAAMGWVHGDIHPGTVVICPAEHGLRLDGWWSAVRLGERLTVKPAAPTPPRWLGGAGASEQLSVAQAAAYLRTVTAPKRLIEVFDEHATNPGSAGQFFSDVREVAHRVYGKAVWHELAEPAETPI
jgi:hypothetical protein